MKKHIVLAIAAGLLACPTASQAVDVKMDGDYSFQFTQYGGVKFAGDKYDSETQRVRIGMTFTASENLSGYVQFQAKWEWGLDDADPKTGKGGLGNHPNTALRLAYIDWVIPSTPLKVRMGRQIMPVTIFATGKNPITFWPEPIDGIAVRAKATDWLSVYAWWGRFDRHNSFETNLADTLDMFYAAADLRFDGFGFSPFAAFITQDNNTLGTSYAPTNNALLPGKNFLPPNGYSNNTFWVGANASLTLFDPLTIKADAVYGDRNFRDSTGLPSQHGWFIDGAISYKTSYGTPELALWYGSGDDDDVAYAYQDNMPTLFGRFAGSYGFFAGHKLVDNRLQCNHTGMGTWGAKLGMKNISFLEDLSHEIAVVYAQGTNDNANAKFGKDAWRYMTAKDSMVEFDFGTSYKIYKNLSAWLECAYILENFETKHASGAYATRKSSYDDAWKVALLLSYKF